MHPQHFAFCVLAVVGIVDAAAVVEVVVALAVVAVSHAWIVKCIRGYSRETFQHCILNVLCFDGGSDGGGGDPLLTDSTILILIEKS